MSGRVLPIPAGTRGFDCNRKLTAVEAQKFFGLGYRFAVRYLPRVTIHAGDLTKDEVDHLFASGLAVMAVQHVESEASWEPTLLKGEGYGRVAGDVAKAVGLAEKTCVWLDLEGVSVDFLPSAPERSKVIIEYCNAWFKSVAEAGFTPSLYVGWHAGLTAEQLYRDLAFKNYWAAYNLNRDQEPANRGVQMKQGVARKGDVPAGVAIDIDTDMVMADKNGGLPLAFAPDEWAV